MRAINQSFTVGFSIYNGAEPSQIGAVLLVSLENPSIYKGSDSFSETPPHKNIPRTACLFSQRCSQWIPPDCAGPRVFHMKLLFLQTCKQAISRQGN